MWAGGGDRIFGGLDRCGGGQNTVAAAHGTQRCCSYAQSSRKDARGCHANVLGRERLVGVSFHSLGWLLNAARSV